ncbi:MAG TPA: ATP-binding cassette domain-containing protein [Chloroflexia bacterium]|nr:ATP-binding cassette domain-containing protein [Chloroflexia bacterium]
MSYTPQSGTFSPLISTQQLTKLFKGRPAVNKAEFVVQPGDVFGLLGPNGAGKTTIIRMLLGLVKPTSGQAFLFGKDIATGKADILRRTSAIVEAPSLYPHLTGWDNLKVMGLTAGVTDPKRLEWALDQMGLRERAKDRFRTYSLGMKQRLCIAAALLTDPQLIILDEPTNGLDPAGMRDIRELIKSLSAQGRTVFLSSHLLNEVQQVCNRVAIIDRGTIIAQGIVDELLSARSYLQVRVPLEQLTQAAQTVSALPGVGTVKPQGEYLVVEGASANGATLNRALAQAGIFASEIIPRTLSLEEYFLSVTGQMPPQPGPGYGYAYAGVPMQPVPNGQYPQMPYPPAGYPNPGQSAQYPQNPPRQEGPHA